MLIPRYGETTLREPHFLETAHAALKRQTFETDMIVESLIGLVF